MAERTPNSIEVIGSGMDTSVLWEALGPPSKAGGADEYKLWIRQHDDAAKPAQVVTTVDDIRAVIDTTEPGSPARALLHDILNTSTVDETS